MQLLSVVFRVVGRESWLIIWRLLLHLFGYQFVGQTNHRIFIWSFNID